MRRFDDSAVRDLSGRVLTYGGRGARRLWLTAVPCGVRGWHITVMFSHRAARRLQPERITTTESNSVTHRRTHAPPDLSSPVGDFDRGDRKRSPGHVVQLSPLRDMKARGAGRDTQRHDSRLHENQPRAISSVFTLPAAPSPAPLPSSLGLFM